MYTQKPLFHILILHHKLISAELQYRDIITVHSNDIRCYHLIPIPSYAVKAILCSVNMTGLQ